MIDCKEVMLLFSMKSQNKIDIINLAQLLILVSMEIKKIKDDTY
jgi:hypothetical protein